MRMLCPCVLVIFVAAHSALGATVRVPQDQPTIQAAIDAANAGDTILVAPGKYTARLRLKPGIILRKDDADAKGTPDFKRVEVTILDGGGQRGMEPGVVMAEGSVLDGFTITNVGVYDDATWKKHFDTHGEELGDDEGAMQAEGTVPAVSIVGVTCTVVRCIVHHNGDVGIGIIGKPNVRTAPQILDNLVYRNMGGGIGVAEGAEAVVRGNTCRENLRAGIGCRKSNPLVADNVCLENVRAGIGCREGAQPTLLRNKCSHNRRAGIGVRMEGTAPLIDGNECFENEMAGIGCRDEARPILRNNLCRKNKLAGIGCRDGARPLIVDNVCRENEQAGIGVEKSASAVIQGNQCVDNQLVAIGVTSGATATILKNELSRTGGAPPLIAVKDDSTATIEGNRLHGGGVAAVLVQGTATVRHNTFIGAGPQQGNAIWVWENATANITGNSMNDYRTAVNAVKATVFIAENSVKGFQGSAIIVKDSLTPAHVFGNTANSTDSRAKVVDVQGAAGIVAENILKN